VKSIKLLILFLLVTLIVSIPASGQHNFPSVYIDGNLFYGKVILYDNILYAECDDLMNAINGTHIFNIHDNIHFINNQYFPSEYVYIHQNRFYFYLKYAVLFGGARSAEYNQEANTVIIEFPSYQTGSNNSAYNNSNNQSGSSDYVAFDDMKEDETGFTDHYDENQKLDAILNEVRSSLVSRFNMEVPAALQVLAIDRDQLEYVSQDEGLIDGTNICGLYWKNKIYIQFGLATAKIYEVMAHEYTHAWQRYNCPKDQEGLLTEGFAEWVAYKYTQGKTGGSTFTTKEGTVYGDGLKFCLDLEARSGEQAVIEFVKKNKYATQ